MTTEQTAEYFEFLDELRESGQTNMFGARPYLMRKFPELAEGRGEAAGKVLSHWMSTFDPSVTAFDRAQQPHV